MRNAVTLDVDEIQPTVGRMPPSARTYEVTWYGLQAHRPPWIAAGWRPRPGTRASRSSFAT